MKKQAISILLTLALLAALLPVGIPCISAASETDIVYHVNGGYLYFDKATGTITDCTESVTSADIPAEIKGVSVTGIASGAFARCKELHWVGIPASVTTIGSDAFRYCSNLQGIYVDEASEHFACDEDGVALLNKDGTVLLQYPAGLGCPCGYGLYYTIPDGVTTIADYAFYGCLAAEITVPESVEHIGNYAFLGSKGLQYVWFMGDAPQTGEHFFDIYNDETAQYEAIPNLKICYPEGKEGWTSPTWKGYPASAWEPHEHELTLVEVAPTCTEDGFEALVCFCGYQIIASHRSAYGHDYQNGICIRCGEAESEHICEYTAVVTAPTCTEKGYTTYTCACGDSYVADYVDALGHGYTAAVTAPTCTEKGYTTYTCACGDSYTADEVAALGHDYQEGSCTRCGEADPDYKPEIPPADFNDVSEDAWYKGAVDYAVASGLMNGTGNKRFEPESPMTRAMLVTVLWRYAGEPAEGENIFSDVEDSEWYAKAVAWAAENGIVGGVGNGRFEPEGEITREQMAAILYRYCNSEGIDTSKREALTAFPDGDKTSAYAQDAISWAVAEGLIAGSKVNGKLWLAPQGNATRAQVATILMRFIENIVK